MRAPDVIRLSKGQSTAFTVELWRAHSWQVKCSLNLSVTLSVPHCICDTLHALDFVLECLHERTGARVWIALVHPCSFSSPPIGSPPLIMQGELLFECRGLENMNYAHSGLHVPHGPCLWLKLEVLRPLTTPPESFFSVCYLKKAVQKRIICFQSSWWLGFWCLQKSWWLIEAIQLSLGPNFSMRYYLIFIYFFRYSLDVNKRHFLALDPKALGSLKHKLAVSCRVFEENWY